MADRCTVCRGLELEPAKLTGAQESVRQNVPDEIPYQVCTRCGLWLQFPPPDFNADAEKDRKASIQEEAGHYNWLAKRLVSQYSPRSVLDIGSSYPLFLHYVKKEHGINDVLGIDRIDQTLPYAAELGVSAAQADFLAHDFKGKTFDMVTMIHTLGYFRDPRTPVLKLKSLLNPGGVLFIRTPLNDTEGLVKWHLTAHHCEIHPIIFGQRSLKMLFELAGFELAVESVGNTIGHGDYDFRRR